jgi:pSer/pThr/pTyr-binding forkhead associated (FHA) protein
MGRTEGQIRLDHPGVARAHARLEIARDGTALLRDLHTETGTFVNGERITEQRPA